MNQWLPAGATEPDEVIMVYVSEALSPDERAEVERWLRTNPAWTARVAAYRNIRAAARATPPGVDASPPDLGSLDGLWAAIDQHKATSSPSPQTGAVPPPPPFISLTEARQRKSRRGPWLAAAAALAVAGVAGALALRDDGGTEDAAPPAESAPPAASTAEPTAAADSPSAAEPPAAPAPSTPGAADDLEAALRISAESTNEQRTASIEIRAVGSMMVESTAGAPSSHLIRVNVAGTGVIEFPGRSMVQTLMSSEVDGQPGPMPDTSATVVAEDGETYVRCAGSDQFLPSDGSQGAVSCNVLTDLVAPTVFGPDATVAMLLEGADVDVEGLGLSEVQGVPVSGYQIVESRDIDGTGPVPMVVQIYVDGDGLIRRTVAAAELGPPEERMNIVISFDLVDFGVAADIPQMD